MDHENKRFIYIIIFVFPYGMDNQVTLLDDDGLRNVKKGVKTPEN